VLEGERLLNYEVLHRLGHGAKDSGDHSEAFKYFNLADEIAIAADDPLKQLHARTPAARALWSMGQFDAASQKMDEVKVIADDLELVDEQAIAISNIGRIAAVKIAKTMPLEEHREALRERALPHFEEARKLLKGHSHHYYAYANGHHGSMIAALAGKRWQSAKLLMSGLFAAFRRSPDYDVEKRTYEVNKKGLGQMAVAAALLPLGDRTPILARRAREFIR